jgi:hypothetical protein
MEKKEEKLQKFLILMLNLIVVEFLLKMLIGKNMKDNLIRRDNENIYKVIEYFKQNYFNYIVDNQK